MTFTKIQLLFTLFLVFAVVEKNHAAPAADGKETCEKEGERLKKLICGAKCEGTETAAKTFKDCLTKVGGVAEKMIKDISGKTETECYEVIKKHEGEVTDELGGKIKTECLDTMDKTARSTLEKCFA